MANTRPGPRRPLDLPAASTDIGDFVVPNQGKAKVVFNMLDAAAAIRFVLVETSHPGNIGAAARAIKTMGFNQLALVNPLSYPCAEATARASGADDVLAAARVYQNLADALSDCTLVIGTSARSRTIPWPMLNARECAAKATEAAAHGTVALVFGREHSGLSNDELELCSYHVNIPANPAYSSLNLAAAVQVIAYEMRMTLGGVEGHGAPTGRQEPLASMAEIERFYAHLEQALVQIGFLDPDNPRQLMRRLRRLFNRAELELTEVNILRGILTAAQGRKRPPSP